MTKEAKPAKPVRMSVDEWAEVDKAAKKAGKSRSAYVADVALAAARGELKPNASRQRVRDTDAKVKAVRALGPNVTRSSDVERRPAFVPTKEKN